jgi:hypothetical protein
MKKKKQTPKTNEHGRSRLHGNVVSRRRISCRKFLCGEVRGAANERDDADALSTTSAPHAALDKLQDSCIPEPPNVFCSSANRPMTSGRQLIRFD